MLRKSLLAATLAATLTAVPAMAATTVHYDAVPSPTPSNVPSLGYQATSTSEFGQLVEPASAGPLTTATVTMSSWACETGQWNLGDCTTTPGATFDHPVTVNLYEVDGSGAAPAAGALLGTTTRTVAVPYRPSVDGAAGCDTGWYAEDLGACTDGYAFDVTFDLSGLGLTIDGPVIVTVAYDTQSYGDDPIGTPGPYNALNVGVDLSGDQPTVGTAGDVFWASTYPGATPELSNDGDWGWAMMVRLGHEVATADECRDGGYAAFGFRNQGQCIASVKAAEPAGR